MTSLDGTAAIEAGQPADGAIDQATRAAWSAAGLYDPHAPRAAARLELLRWIASMGHTIEEMVDAAARGQLAALPGDAAMRPGTPRTSLRQIAAELDAPLHALETIRRASGLPPVDADAVVFTPSDVVMLRSFVAAATIFSTDELLHFTRVMGTSMRRIADAAREMFLLDVEEPIVRELEDSEIAVGRKSLEAVEMIGAAIAVFEPMFRAHLEESNRASRSARAGSRDFVTMPLAVGFVDLSGFTSQAERVSARELLDLVLAFEAQACDLVADHGGRVVKLIGDEVMYTTVDAWSACIIASRLVREVAAPTNAQPRGGVCFGPVVAHGGDLYGGMVNRAARMADVAVPGEVLVDAGVVHHVTDATPAGVSPLAFEPAGRRMLKGFSEAVALWSIAG